MRLAAKLTAALILGICGVTFAFAYLQLHREIGLFDRELAKDQRLLGNTLRDAVLQNWRTGGPDAAAALLRTANATGEGVRFRWVSFNERAAAANKPAVPTVALHLLHDDETRALIADDESGTARRYTYVGLQLPGDPLGALEVSESLDEQHAYLRLTKLQALYATLANVLVSSLLAVGVGLWFVGSPVRRLVQQARRIGAGDLSQRVDAAQHDELGELSREFDAMCDQLTKAQRRLAEETETRIATVEQLRHADRLATVGKLASGIAHELGTPLNVIGARAKMILSGTTPPADLLPHARSIVDQTDRMISIIRQLLDFSRRRGPTLRTVDLQALTEATATMVAPLAHKRRVSLTVTARSQPVQADASQLQQVLTNILVNGIQGMPNGGPLHIELGAAERPPPIAHPSNGRSWVFIRITDQGYGIAAEHLPLIFEPFFTTKGVGEGTGLGLSVAYGIVRDHGGWIDVESEPGRGSCFTVYLPQPGSAENTTEGDVG